MIVLQVFGAAVAVMLVGIVLWVLGGHIADKLGQRRFKRGRRP